MAFRQMLSCLVAAMGGGAFWGCVAPQAQIFSGELTALVHALSNLIWGKLFLSRDTYPTAESSWRLDAYY
jgi:hypothetical protein